MARSRKRGVLTPKQASQLGPHELRRMVRKGWLPPIGGGALESNINGLWVAKQTGKGVPAVAMTKRPRWVGGDLNTARADGNEIYSDSSLFGDKVDFVNQINGNGAPVVMGQSGIIAYLSWLAGGQEVVTGGANEEHQIAITGGPPTGGETVAAFNGFSFTVPFDMTAAAFQAALLAAVNSQGVSLPAGSIVVGGGPLPGTPLTVTFQDLLGNQAVPVESWSFADSFTGGGGATGATELTPGTGRKHVSTPANVGGFWSSWLKSVGASVAYRAQFNDCRISSLRYEGSSASKVVKLTPTLMVLDPGVLAAADPVVADDGTKPFVYTEAAGTFTIDGQVYRGHSAFAIEVQYGLTEWYGDDVTPFDLINAAANVVLQGVTILLDQQGLQRYNEQIYGTANPAPGARPLHTIPALGSYSCEFKRVNPFTNGVSESAKFEVPSVKWDPNLSIPANPAGGPTEFAMAGEYRKDPAGAPAWRVTAVTPFDAAYTA